jgi:type IV pilus assembly protein PilA
MKKGFTLIELLVVIAIIGILSAIMIPNLNKVRNRGIDVAVKGDVIQAKTVAEIYYDGAGESSYDDVCSDSTDGILTNLQAVATALGLATSVVDTGEDTAWDDDTIVCNDGDDGWAVMVPLKDPATDGDGYCVDATGYAGEQDALAATDVTCDAAVVAAD